MSYKMCGVFYGYGDHRDLHVLTHSCPTGRLSERAMEKRFQDADRKVSALTTAVGQLVEVLGRRARDGGGVDRRGFPRVPGGNRSEEHTSELQSLMRISYAVFCLTNNIPYNHTQTYLTIFSTLLALS